MREAQPRISRKSLSVEHLSYSPPAYRRYYNHHGQSELACAQLFRDFLEPSAPFISTLQGARDKFLILSDRASASSIDSLRRSWYLPVTTPIASPVGSRPPAKAVSVFVRG